MQNQSVRQRLLEMIQQQALTRLQSDDLWQMVFTEPPFDLPHGVTTTYHPGKPISAQDSDPAYASDLIHNWAKLQIHSSRFPLLGLVLEGSIDWRIGITTKMAKNGGKVLSRSNYVTLGMPRGSFFLMPPGVPYSEPGRNHRVHPLQQKIPVRALWIQFHRFGMQCYTSYTVSGKIIFDSACYIPDSRTIFAAEALVEELRFGRHHSRKIVNTLLLFCMQRLERAIQNDLTKEINSAVSVSMSQSGETNLVEQACLYVEAHFDQKMTLEDIAAHVYISRSRLADLFQAAKGMSINEYLTRFRMDYVCSLLEKTDLRINHIGKISGYRNPSYFCQVFQRRMGCSPQEYRSRSINKCKAA